ncbi:MAG: TolC family protein [Burkholderiales bacterium]|nr:TolC family protein [Burkholderiales bacterium]
MSLLRPPRPLLRAGRAVLCALALAAAGLPAVRAAGCGEAAPGASPTPPAPARTAGDPREPLRSLARVAVERNAGVAAARLLADAAQDDIREAQAAKLPQASFTAGLGPAAMHAASKTETSAAQWRAGIAVNQMLYDGGRLDRQIDVRRLQGEVMRLSRLTQEEQLVLGTVSAAFEFSRYRQQAGVYAEYRQSAACLVEALEQVVAADRGRLSELVQARKSLLQVELGLAQTEAAARQAALRLRRFVGEQGVEPAALAPLLRGLPALDTVLAEAERASEIAQLQAQAQAAEALAQAVALGNKPQLSWSAGLNQGAAFGGTLPTSHNRSLSLGLNLSIPLLNPGFDAGLDAARKRARSAQLQVDEALDSRKSRIADVHDQARSAFERARLTEDILRDSERLRGFTLQQWQQLGRRSLFDVMAAESDHFGLRLAHVNALVDGQQLNATLQSLGRGLLPWLR